MLKSATAPAGKVKRKNGSEAAVAISESSNGEAPNALMSHVAAVSWAATQTPETTLGNHSATKAGFLSANQMEVFCFGSLAIRNRKDDLYPTRFNELISRQLSTLTHFPLPQKPLKPIEGALTLAIAPCAVIE